MLVHTVGIVCMPLTTMIVLLIVELFTSKIDMGAVVAAFIGLVVLAAMCFYYWYLLWHFIKLSLLLHYGKTADAILTEHQYERRKSVSTNKGRTSVTYTDVYSGELSFTTDAHEPILLKFEVKDPGKEREAIQNKTSLLQVWYLPRRPQVACIAWQGDALYRPQVKRAFWLTLLWMLSLAAVAYEQSLPASLRILPESFSALLGLGYVAIPFVVWFVIGSARKRYI